MSDHPIIGILGGMGPEATVDLMRRVIAATPAEDDIDHIHMIVDNNPKVPSRIAALIDGTGEDPAPALADMARGLETAGAHALAMPCNTAHNYLPAIRDAVSIPVLDMIELTASAVTAQEPKPNRVGLLASTAVNLTGLYAEAFSSRGVELIIPDRQDDLMAVIMAVKRGDMSGSVTSELASITRELVDSGAETLLLACTELSILADHVAGDVPVIDALDVLSDAIVTFGLDNKQQNKSTD